MKFSEEEQQNIEDYERIRKRKRLYSKFREFGKTHREATLLTNKFIEDEKKWEKLEKRIKKWLKEDKK